MSNESEALPLGWTSEVSNWTCHHFSLSDTEENTPRLLRKLAAAIEDLGDIQLLNIAFSLQTEGPQFEVHATVYFDYHEDEGEDEEEEPATS